MRKWRCFIDFKKEEKWLEEMAKQGYHLKSVSFGYTFRIASPEDEKIKMDYRMFKRRRDFIDYCTLFEDSGWEHIAGSWWTGNQYFKRMDKDSGDDIFSGTTSRAGKYKRLSTSFMQLAISYVTLFTLMCVAGVMNVNIILVMKELFLEGELWDAVSNILIESPFALVIGFLWIFAPVTMILSLFFWYKANILYKQSKV